MRLLACALTVCALGCAAQSSSSVGVDPGETGGSGSGSGSGMGSGSGSMDDVIPDVRCAGVPDVGPTEGFDHLSSSLIAELGSPHHRGFDLVTGASADPQVIQGAIGYTLADKALEDEAVDVFACRAGAWQKLGRVRTDSEGRFELDLSASDRLPIGMRDLYVSVAGDRTGAEFLGFVAHDGAKLVVSDVDGTLTSSENAFVESLVLGTDPSTQEGAAGALSTAANEGYTLVYMTARGNQYTDDTRTWLANHGFPRGPLHLAPSFFTLPGSATVDYKTTALEGLTASFEVSAGIGNRDSDITAYTNAGVAADHIFIKLPEYQDEVAADLATGKAVGFTAYDDLRTQQLAGM